MWCVHIPLRLYLSQDPNSGVVLSYLQDKQVKNAATYCLLLRLFHFVVDDPAGLGFPRKQDGGRMDVESLQ
jgi:hypothetical protein